MLKTCLEPRVGLLYAYIIPKNHVNFLNLIEILWRNLSDFQKYFYDNFGIAKKQGIWQMADVHEVFNIKNFKNGFIYLA